MGTQALSVQSKNLVAVENILHDSISQIAAVLPKHLTPDRMISVAMELVRSDSKLAKATPLSVLAGVVEAAQLGLVLTKTLGHGYLVPFKNGLLSRDAGHDVYEVVFMVGYKGFIHLAMNDRDSNATAIFARLVYPLEHFRIFEGTEHRLEHTPNQDGGAIDEYIGAYAVVVFKNAVLPDFEYMSRDEIERARAVSKAKSEDSPWQTWPGEMVKKTVIRRLCKRLKLSPEVSAAIGRDEYRDYVTEQPGTTLQMPRRRSEAALPVAAEMPSQPAKPASPTCKEHNREMKLIPGGVSKTSGKSYDAFWKCQEKGCAEKSVKDSDWQKQQSSADVQPAESHASTATAGEGAAPASSPGVAPEQEKPDYSWFKPFMKECEALKKRNEKIYYQVLGLNGMEHANEAKTQLQALKLVSDMSDLMDGFEKHQEEKKQAEQMKL